MRVPWLRLFSALVSAVDCARVGASRALGREEGATQGKDAPGRWWMEREQRRMDFERERMEVERQRVERAWKLDMLRRSGDREIGRLRLMAGVAAASLVGALLFSAQLVSTAFWARVLLGGAWILLVTALALSFSGQARVAAALARLDDTTGREALASGVAGTLVPWLVVGGLALVGMAALAA